MFLPVRHYFVYILASHSRTLYVGVTNNLARRVYEHRHGWSKFTVRYRIHRLVYFETRPHPMQAIVREKQIKRLSRVDKMRLIEKENPAWEDYAERWFDPLPPGSD